MASDNLISASQGRIFQCSSCKEYINDSMSNCRFCGTSVDFAVAQSAADIQDKTNQACNDGNFIQTMARATIVMYLVSWAPLIGGAGGWGFLILMLSIPVMIVRWWLKYRNIQTGDQDYQVARGRTVISLAIWGGMIVVWLIGSILYALLFSKLLAGIN
jgi:hypothetical protein